MRQHIAVGRIERQVLAAISKLRDAYSVSIQNEIEEFAEGRLISLGGIYSALDRLEEKGFVSSWRADPTAERGGQAKLRYRLEALGERTLRESAATENSVWSGFLGGWGREWAEKWGKHWGKETG